MTGRSCPWCYHSLPDASERLAVVVCPGCASILLVRQRGARRLSSTGLLSIADHNPELFDRLIARHRAVRFCLNPDNRAAVLRGEAPS